MRKCRLSLRRWHMRRHIRRLRLSLGLRCRHMRRLRRRLRIGLRHMSRLKRRHMRRHRLIRRLGLTFMLTLSGFKLGLGLELNYYVPKINKDPKNLLDKAIFKHSIPIEISA
jgi:hypothetical protein